MGENEKMRFVLLRIAGWNVYHLLSKNKGENYSEMFEDVSFDEISLNNLNYPVLKLSADKHLVIGLRFNFNATFLRNNFQLYGYINKRPYLRGEIVFGRKQKFKEVLGYEFKIINAPQNQVYYCRFCPYDIIEPGDSTLLEIILKNRRNFEEEFNNFYNSSLVHI